jgi:hypothetical protein
MSDEEIKRQIEACESNRNAEKFAPSVDALFNMLPADTRSEIEKVDGVYKETESYVNRFINNVLITVEFVTTRALDHDALYSAIIARVEKS